MKVLNYELTGIEYFLLIIGSYLFGFSFDVLVGSFGLYYYRPDLEKAQRKVCRILMFAVIPVIILSVILLNNYYKKILIGSGSQKTVNIC